MKTAFAPHQIRQDQIQALHDNILVADMEFDTRITQSGLILANDNGTTLGIRPRWGRVYAVGPKQTEFKVGQWIMVAHGRWTRGVKIEEPSGNELTIRRVDNNDVLLVSDEQPQDDTLAV